MFIIKNKILGVFLLTIILITGLLGGVEIKGKVNVHNHEKSTWSKYAEKLKVSLSGDLTGEASKPVNYSQVFSFKDVNPEDFIEINWENKELSSNYVLFPIVKEGNAKKLSNGLIQFRFRDIEWVFDKSKEQVQKKIAKGKLAESDKIINNFIKYHQILSKHTNANKRQLDLFKYKLLQFVCQNLEKYRIKKKVFRNPSNFSIQQNWYLELLKTAGNKEYHEIYPADIIRALNQWSIFTRRAYAKGWHWSDENLNFNDPLIDNSFKDPLIRELLRNDLEIISKILDSSNNKKLHTDLFNIENSINMNSITSWITQINRNVKPLKRK